MTWQRRGRLHRQATKQLIWQTQSFYADTLTSSFDCVFRYVGLISVLHLYIA